MGALPTIPPPTADTASHLQTLLALKQCVDLLMCRNLSGATQVRLFKGNIAPGAKNSTINISYLQDGDLWLNTSVGSVSPPITAIMNYWDVSTMAWKPI